MVALRVRRAAALVSAICVAGLGAEACGGPRSNQASGSGSGATGGAGGTAGGELCGDWDPSQQGVPSPASVVCENEPPPACERWANATVPPEYPIGAVCVSSTECGLGFAPRDFKPGTQIVVPRNPCWGPDKVPDDDICSSLSQRWVRGEDAVACAVCQANIDLEGNEYSDCIFSWCAQGNLECAWGQIAVARGGHAPRCETPCEEPTTNGT